MTETVFGPSVRDLTAHADEEKIMDVREYTENDFEHVTLETPKAQVIPFPGTNLEWLMRDVSSTPYAEVRS